MKTNCLIHAWREYASGRAMWFAYRRSNYSRFTGKVPWYIRLFGWPVLYISGALWLVGHYAVFGTWPHFISCRSIKGDCTEIVPKKRKTKRFLPPILFEPIEHKRRKDDALF